MKYKWTKIEQDNVGKIKRIVACNTLLTYTDFNEAFKINTDGSNFQVGEVIKNKVKLIDFYGRKLNYYQKSYAVT